MGFVSSGGDGGLLGSDGGSSGSVLVDGVGTV